MSLPNAFLCKVEIPKGLHGCLYPARVDKALAPRPPWVHTAGLVRQLVDQVGPVPRPAGLVGPDPQQVDPVDQVQRRADQVDLDRHRASASWVTPMGQKVDTMEMGIFAKAWCIPMRITARMKTSQVLPETQFLSMGPWLPKVSYPKKNWTLMIQ